MQASSRFLSSVSAGGDVAARSNVALRACSHLRARCSHAQGKSAVASMPDEKEYLSKSQKKFQTRRAMVETFVEKYKLSNLGKFPPASVVRKEVGGSHYTIRGILQEMKHTKSDSLSPSGKWNTVTNANTEANVSPDVSGNMETIDLATGLLVETDTHPSESLYCSDHPEDTDLSREHATCDNLIGSEQTKSFAELEEANTVTVLTSLQDSTVAIPSSSGEFHERENGAKGIHELNCASDSPKETENSEPGTAGRVESKSDPVRTTERTQPRTDKSDSEHFQVRHEPEESPSPRTFLSDLKSLADGIINFWRRL